MRILVTGSAGFIGFHVAKRFLNRGHTVVGYDSMNDYYSPALKYARLDHLRTHRGFQQVSGSLEDAPLLTATVTEHNPDLVIHLAAQAGVRYSIENPNAYISSNVQGTFNLLEALRHTPPKHLLLASTSSVYGANTEFPFRETTRTSFPVSLYAATKSACEAISHSYSSLYGIPTTCFRFFTVYGPWGRPDMAPLKFVKKISRGETIDVYGNGEMSRDFTYIDDLVEGITRLSDVIPAPGRETPTVTQNDSLSPVAPWRTVNIAGGQPVPLMRFIRAIEISLGKEATKNMMPMQPGDVSDTLASPDLLETLTGFKPKTTIESGVQALVDWYQEHYDATS